MLVAAGTCAIMWSANVPRIEYYAYNAARICSRGMRLIEA
jgi:hypothetical protein